MYRMVGLLFTLPAGKDMDQLLNYYFKENTQMSISVRRYDTSTIYSSINLHVHVHVRVYKAKLLYIHVYPNIHKIISILQHTTYYCMCSISNADNTIEVCSI